MILDDTNNLFMDVEEPSIVRRLENARPRNKSELELGPVSDNISLRCVSRVSCSCPPGSVSRYQTNANGERPPQHRVKTARRPTRCAPTGIDIRKQSSKMIRVVRTPANRQLNIVKTKSDLNTKSPYGKRPRQTYRSATLCDPPLGRANFCKQLAACNPLAPQTKPAELEIARRSPSPVAVSVNFRQRPETPEHPSPVGKSPATERAPRTKFDVPSMMTGIPALAQGTVPVKKSRAMTQEEFDNLVIAPRSVSYHDAIDPTYAGIDVVSSNQEQFKTTEYLATNEN